MRVTTRGNYLTTLAHLRNSRSRESTAINRLSSGLQVARASDDPTAAAAIENSTRTLARIGAQMSRADGVESQLATYDTALASAVDIVGRMHQLAIQLGSDTYNGANREATAEEFRALQDALRSVANTEVDGSYVFSGNRTDQPAFDATNTYQGDAATREVELSPGNRITINIDGDEAFRGAGGGTDIFAAIERTITALEADDAEGVRDEIGNFLDGIDQLSHLQTRVGGRLTSVTQLRDRNQDEQLRETTLLASVADVDLAEVTTELATAQLAVQAAMTATARISELSLFDLL